MTDYLKDWPQIPKMPLPPSLASLPTVEAKVKYRIANGRSRPSIEGPCFDRAGNLYVCHTVAPCMTVKKITPDGVITDFFKYDKGMLVATAVHKDGRIFGADFVNGVFVVISPEGELLDEIKVTLPEGGSAQCDDMTFDREGNLYFTDFNGTFAKRTGGVYKLSAESGYREITPILRNIGAGNGISFSPDYSVLWVADTPLKQIYRIVLDENGLPLDRVFGILPISQCYGIGNPDSNKVDSEGNLYQAIMHMGWILIFNKYGIPIANVVVPGQEQGRLLNTPNLAIEPGKNEAYMVASDDKDVCVLTFPTLAAGEGLYSHM